MAYSLEAAHIRNKYLFLGIKLLTQAFKRYAGLIYA